MTTGVYIARDASGAALYVGSAGDIDDRLVSHRRTKPWWSEVASVERRPTENRYMAYHLERCLIAELKPPHNSLSKDGAQRVSRATGPVIAPRIPAFAALFESYGSVAIFARAAGVDHQTMSNIWRGVYFPSAKVVARVMALTGMTFDELFEITEGEPGEWLARRPGRTHGFAA